MAEPAKVGEDQFEGGAQPATVLSAVTGGDLAQDPAWREIFGPAGVGDYLYGPLMAGGTCWAQLHFWRDSSDKFFSSGDAEFMTEVAPVLAARLRDGLRSHPPYDESAPRDDPVPQTGTILVDEELSTVAATQAAWDWIDRLGLAKPNEAEPLPGFIYAAATHAAMSRTRDASQPPVRVRLQAGDGRWRSYRWRR